MIYLICLQYAYTLEAATKCSTSKVDTELCGTRALVSGDRLMKTAMNPIHTQNRNC